MLLVSLLLKIVEITPTQNTEVCIHYHIKRWILEFSFCWWWFKKKTRLFLQKKTPRIQKVAPKHMNYCTSKRKSLAPSNCDVVQQSQIHRTRKSLSISAKYRSDDMFDCNMNSKQNKCNVIVWARLVSLVAAWSRKVIGVTQEHTVYEAIPGIYPYIIKCLLCF